MLPFRDHFPSSRTAWVNRGLIALNCAIFLFLMPDLQGGATSTDYLDRWALLPDAVTDGHRYSGLLTSLFLHGGWVHLISNMLFLAIFGENVEDQLGHLGYLVFYLLAGVGAGLIQVSSDPQSAIPVIGASGAVAGVMAGHLLLFPRARIDVLLFFVVTIRILPVRAWGLLLVWFGFQLIKGFSQSSALDPVAYWAHIGGFLLGLALIFPVWLWKGGPQFWKRNQQRHMPGIARRHRRRYAAPVSDAMSGAWPRPMQPSVTRVPTVRRRR